MKTYTVTKTSGYPPCYEVRRDGAWVSLALSLRGARFIIRRDRKLRAKQARDLIVHEEEV